MSTWWDGLSIRERVLLGIAAALVALFALWQLAVSPVIAARAEAADRHLAATRALDVVTSALPHLKPAPARGEAAVRGAPGPDELRRQITAVAQQTGLVITQLRTGEDGTVSVLFRDADPRLIFAFVQLARARDGIAPAEVTITRTEPGLVRATLDFSAGVPA